MELSTIVADVALGLTAGLAGTWVMERFQTIVHVIRGSGGEVFPPMVR